jgi:hypothetical protein
MGDDSTLFLVTDFPQMNLMQMHERLRLELLRRIQRGTLSVSLLARQTGFGQSHLSNFLHNRRQLSLDAIDRILSAQQLEIADFLPSTSQPAAASGDEENSSVPIVSHTTALFEPFVRAAAVQSTLRVPDNLLHSLRAHGTNPRLAWQRFVAVRIQAADALPMEPLVMPEAIALIDRHYTSLAPYRLTRPNLYAVSDGAHLTLRYVELLGGKMVLRPNSLAHPLDLLKTDLEGLPRDGIVGRIALILNTP